MSDKQGIGGRLVGPPSFSSALYPAKFQDSQRFQQVADNLQEVFALSNADLSEFLYVNRAYERISGRTVESLYADPRSFFDAVYPQDRERFEQAIEALIRGTQIDDLECRVTRLDGTTAWVSCRAYPIREASGQIQCLVGIAQEITARKTAEDQLRQSEDRYRDLVEHSQDLICTHDLNGILLSVNDPPLRILGYSREELLNKPLRDFVTLEARAHCDAYLAQVQQYGFARGLLPVLTKSGEVRIWEYNNSLRTDVASPIVRGMAHDVTEQKRAEASLRQLSGQLLRSEEKERRKIAQELHGTTGQRLHMMASLFKKLKPLIPEDNTRVRNIIAQCVELTNRSIQEVRTLSYSLFPPMLEEAGLESAIRVFIEGFSQHTGIVVDLQISVPRMIDEVELAIFRVVQECLVNIHRHSGSRVAVVGIERKTKKIEVEITDEGRGISEFQIQYGVRVPRTTGVGILSLIERVKHFDGELGIESSTHGTTIRVRMPIYERRG